MRSTIVGPMLLIAVAQGCGDDGGILSAERTGSIGHELAPRIAADRELIELCGQGTDVPADSRVFERPPFLQQVDADSALLVFRAATPPQSVSVTTFQGQPVTSVTPERDASVPHAQQWIARLEGLSPATGYCYSLSGVKARVGFRTAPAPHTQKPVRFVAFGDSGDGDYQRTIFEQFRSVPFDLLLHMGDIAYSSGTETQLDRQFFRMYAPILRSFAAFPAAGNHDYSTNDAAAFLTSFVLPENGDSERHYSFDWGNVHFVALDTERTSAEQAAWLDADLSRSTLPWNIVFGHRPPYSSGEHGSDTGFQKHFGPVLEKHRVPLVLSGHEHDYERTKAQNGVTYIVTGGGGHGTRPVGSSSFTAFSEETLHFVYVDITGNRLLLHAIDGVGREFDQLMIEQDMPRQRLRPDAASTLPVTRSPASGVQ
jgi:acid phosphatase type 7